MIKFDSSLISKYRTELMGISILGIMFAHISAWAEVRNIAWLKFVDSFSRLSHTEGFLFLSGLGLYYSLSKEITPPQLQNNIKGRAIVWQFAIRRFWRLVVPFLIISFPFYCYKDLIQDVDVFKYVMEQSSLYFWFYGNNGMWYISVSIVLYALFPFLFKVVDDNFRNLIFVILAVIAILALMRFAFTDYYTLTKIGYSQFPAFIIGCYFGYMAKYEKNVSLVKYLLAMLAITTVLLIGKKVDGLLFANLYETNIRLMTIPCMCVTISYLRKYSIATYINGIFRWLGKYSLELYILHMFLYGIVFRLFSDYSPSTCGIILFVLTILICQPIHIGVDIMIRRIKNI